MKLKLKNVRECFLNYIFLFLGFTVTAQISTDSPKEIILLIGQSNMAGRAELLDQDYQVVQNGI